MLAILESRDIPHPPLEAVITADEEIGLLGAGALDLSALKGRRLINLDSEEEGHLLCGCAGGMTARCGIPVRFGAVSGCWYEITISGLQGRHSGSEIHKNRANSNLLPAGSCTGWDREWNMCCLNFPEEPRTTRSPGRPECWWGSTAMRKSC